MQNSISHVGARRLRVAGLISVVAILSSGCSSELASYDDVYVPASVGENFPISIVEKPVSLTVDASQGGLQPSDVRRIAEFGRQAAAHATTPVSVAYASRSKLAGAMAREAAKVIQREGVARNSVIITPHDGGGSDVTMTFARKLAETPVCGDFSQNMRGDQFNTSGPNFGCAFQNNVAAMVTRPEDLERAQPMTPASSAAQRPALDNYYGGNWQTPTSDSSTTNSNSF